METQIEVIYQDEYAYLPKIGDTILFDNMGPLLVSCKILHSIQARMSYFDVIRGLDVPECKMTRMVLVEKSRRDWLLSYRVITA